MASVQEAPVEAATHEEQVNAIDDAGGVMMVGGAEGAGEGGGMFTRAREGGEDSEDSSIPTSRVQADEMEVVLDGEGNSNNNDNKDDTVRAETETEMENHRHEENDDQKDISTAITTLPGTFPSGSSLDPSSSPNSSPVMPSSTPQEARDNITSTSSTSNISLASVPADDDDEKTEKTIVNDSLQELDDNNNNHNSTSKSVPPSFSSSAGSYSHLDTTGSSRALALAAAAASPTASSTSTSTSTPRIADRTEQQHTSTSSLKNTRQSTSSSLDSSSSFTSLGKGNASPPSSPSSRRQLPNGARPLNNMNNTATKSDGMTMGGMIMDGNSNSPVLKQSSSTHSPVIKPAVSSPSLSSTSSSSSRSRKGRMQTGQADAESTNSQANQAAPSISSNNNMNGPTGSSSSLSRIHASPSSSSSLTTDSPAIEEKSRATSGTGDSSSTTPRIAGLAGSTIASSSNASQTRERTTSTISNSKERMMNPTSSTSTSSLPSPSTSLTPLPTPTPPIMSSSSSSTTTTTTAVPSTSKANVPSASSSSSLLLSSSRSYSNLQQSQSQPQPQSQAAETLQSLQPQTGEAYAAATSNAPTRYSHAATYSHTQHQHHNQSLPTPSTSHTAQHYPQRASAPVIVPPMPLLSTSPYNTYNTGNTSSAMTEASRAGNGAGAVTGSATYPDTAFVAPQVHLNDTGFGSSSPYPPIGAAQQQRYSLPLQATSGIPGFGSANGASSNIAGVGLGSLGSVSLPPLGSGATSLRPTPTTSYGIPGQHLHLPEMHPSALEARPSNSAPFPPSSSPPRRGSSSNKKGNNNNNNNTVTLGTGSTSAIAAPAAVQQRERPDASRPLGQEICLECLMRDRDMADVEVTGPGIWSRTSDIDFEEALRAEEISIAQQAIAAYASANNSGPYGNGNGNGTGSSAEDAGMTGSNVNINGNASTDENYFIPVSNDGRYLGGGVGGGPLRSPSRESSVSDAGSRGLRHPRFAKKRIGAYDPLTSASLKLWTQINHVSSSQRFKVLQDFVNEQTRLIDLEKQAYAQTVVDRERADKAMRDSPAKMSFDARSSISSTSPAATPKILDVRSRNSGKSRTSASAASIMGSRELLPSGMMVETIDVHRDEKEAKARAKAAGRNSRRGSAQSPSEQRKSFAPSVKSFNALSLYNNAHSHQQQQQHDSLPSPTGSFVPPWISDDRRRFSSPMLSSKYRNASSDNLSRPRQYADSNADLRMSSQSMMAPPAQSLRSPSPSRQSFQTGMSQRDSRGWRKSFWPRSASASVLSFPQSGSMMEMHLGMSQDKHYPVPASMYPNDVNGIGGSTGAGGNSAMRPPGGTWPDNASELGEPGGGISPDENLEAAKTKKKKKKRFQKLFNSLLGTHHHGSGSGANGQEKDRRRKSDQVDQYAERNEHMHQEQQYQYQHQQQQPYQQQPHHNQQQQYYQQQQQQQSTRQSQRRQTSFQAAAAAFQDDYSEPLAPPPPLSYLTGQQPHARSYSSSSQSSASPVIPNGPDQYSLYQNNTRPNSLAVPRNNTNSSSGFISPSTSSSDLNRNRPSSVTSWRSSSNKTGSPQSPRDVINESFGAPMPVIQQSSMEEIAPGMRVMASMEIIKDPEGTDLSTLRREKSLPALPPGENDNGGIQQQAHQLNYGFQHHHHYQQQQHMPPNAYDQGYQRPPGARESRSASMTYPSIPQNARIADNVYGNQGNAAYGHAFNPQDASEWDYNTSTRENDYDGTSSIGKASRKSKMRSRLFSFGNRKSRSSTSPPSSAAALQEQYDVPKASYAPHDAALEAVVRDNPSEMIAYKYPSGQTRV